MLGTDLSSGEGVDVRVFVSILLIAASGWIGTFWSREIRRKPLRLMYLADSLCFLRNEICTCLKPLPEALCSCAESYETLKPFYMKLSECLHSEASFADAWSAEVEELTFLSAENRIAMQSLGTQIGAYDASSQESAFTACIDSLRLYASQLNRTSKWNARFAIELSTACGILIAVVFY